MLNEDRASSDPCVPGVTVLHGEGAIPVSNIFEAVGYRDLCEIFEVLVAELSFHAQANRGAMRDGKVAAVHSVSEQGLWMQRVRHVEAVPPVVDGVKHHIPGFGPNACGLK